jgi:hypothetical protein
MISGDPHADLTSSRAVAAVVRLVRAAVGYV